MAARPLDTAGPIRVGVVGAGAVSQVIHLPTLGLLHDLYAVVAICDVSKAAVDHCCTKFHIPHGYQDSKAMCNRDDIDLIVVASSDEYHCMHVLQAIEAGKHVLVEKPMTLTRSEASAIETARQHHGVAVYVGYMRRYTPVWAVFLEELRKAGPISFARVFDYSGPNDTFVGQSSTEPRAFGQDVGPDLVANKQARGSKIAEEALGASKAKDARLVKVFRLLGSLGSHDISCMRHSFGGVPDRCTAAFASPSADFVGATFQYDKQPPGQLKEGAEARGSDTPFQVSYETGIHEIGTFDAYIEAYCASAIVRIDYDTPYVKGLPIRVTVRQNTGADGRGYEERVIRPTFVDAYSAEFIRLDRALRSQGKHSSNTEDEALDAKAWAQSTEMCTASDAVKDLDVFDMIMQHLS